jgi:2-keto-3-deoxy-L-rhamnonate aldolase RhmA
MIHTRFADRIKAGKPAFGFNTQFADPGLLEMVGRDWDFVWIDIQHGLAHMSDLLNLVRMCDLTGLTSFIRLPADVPDMVSFALDLDAGGVIVAQVERVAQAQALVQAAKYPPIGNRSYGSRRIIDRMGRDYVEKANREQLLILQIESPEAAAIAGSIAAVQGVDGLMIGPDDMKLRLGLPMSAPLSTPELAKAAASVTAATRQNGKLALGFAEASPAGIQASVAAGFNMISLSAIARYIAAGNADMLKVRNAWEA